MQSQSGSDVNTLASQRNKNQEVSREGQYLITEEGMQLAVEKEEKT